MKIEWIDGRAVFDPSAGDCEGCREVGARFLEAVEQLHKLRCDDEVKEQQASGHPPDPYSSTLMDLMTLYICTIYEQSGASFQSMVSMIVEKLTALRAARTGLPRRIVGLGEVMSAMVDFEKATDSKASAPMAPDSGKVH